MEVWLRIFGMLAVVILLIYLLSWVRGFFPKRTLAAWRGTGASTDLQPAEVGILLGCLPGQTVASFALWLEIAGKIRIESDQPLAIRWTGVPPESGPERAFRDAIDGGSTEDGFADVLEVLHLRTNRRMQDFSGRVTSLRYRAFVDSLWGADLAENVDVPGLEAWLVLRDAGRDWERIGTDEQGQRVRRAVRIAGRLEGLLFSDDLLERRCAGAETGFFRFRRDLLPSRPIHRLTPRQIEILTGESPGTGDGTKPSDPPAGDADT